MAQNWEYNIYSVYIRNGKGLLSFGSSDPSLVWKNKNQQGKTGWDELINYGKNGWELVSVTPITENATEASYTSYLVYTFKRPIEEEVSPK